MKMKGIELSEKELTSTKKISNFISHDCHEETPEAKARWFQPLAIAERMDMLCTFTDLILFANQTIAEQKHAQPIAGRICILSNIHTWSEI
jgi:hypothetical protein